MDFFAKKKNISKRFLISSENLILLFILWSFWKLDKNNEIMALYDQDTLLMVHPGAGKNSSNHSKHLAVNRIMEANLLMEIKKW